MSCFLMNKHCKTFPRVHTKTIRKLYPYRSNRWPAVTTCHKRALRTRDRRESTSLATTPRAKSYWCCKYVSIINQVRCCKHVRYGVSMRWFVALPSLFTINLFYIFPLSAFFFIVTGFEQQLSTSQSQPSDDTRSSDSPDQSVEEAIWRDLKVINPALPQGVQFSLYETSYCNAHESAP